jgi:low temperature requirement protein LtrA
MSRFQRAQAGGGAEGTTPLELFYDLVFVFAVTQVSHQLATHLTWAGASEALLTLMVVWWAWNYTTWATNELDVASSIVRLVVLAIMFASLLMAVALPQAFGSRALLFAGAYVVIQVGRSAFLTFAAADEGSIERRRAGRILTWFVVSGVFWVAGALAASEVRPLLWLIALTIDYTAPLVLYWVPGRRRLDSSSWDVETAHFAERFQLFMIIALGEAIVVTGATTAALDLDAARIGALTIAFLSSAALWWLYFDYVASAAEKRLERAGEDRTRLARDGFTYLHLGLVGGVMLVAVGDEIVIQHPTDVLTAQEIAVVVAGPAAYLLAHTLFRLRMARTVGTKRLTGALACLALAAMGPFVPAIVLLLSTLCVLITVIGVERLAARRRSAEAPQLDRATA